MKTEELNIFGIAQKIAGIAKGETRKSLAAEIVKLTLFLQNKTPVYVLFNRKERLVYTTMDKAWNIYGFNDKYELIMTIEESKELNKYKLHTYEQIL